MSTHTRRGFTLIEMLIVIAIIGILASVVLVGLGPIQRQARDSRRISDLRQAQTALELYFTRNGSYPIMQTGVSGWGNLRTALIAAGIGVTNVPDDPRQGSHYQYGSDPAGSSYILAAWLEDTGNSALNSDVDTASIFGVGCPDPMYCVQL